MKKIEILEALTAASKKCDALYHESLAAFKGIPCIVDPDLEGRRYVIHVSKELWQDIQENCDGS